MIISGSPSTLSNRKIKFKILLATNAKMAWGHVGGLVGGFLLGYLLGVPRIGKIAPLKRIVATVILVIGWLALLKMGFTNANLTV